MRVLLVGLTGRMGQEVLAVAEKEAGVEIVAGIGRSAGKSRVKMYSSIDEVKEPVDAVVDFSLPDVFDSVCAWCVREKKPLVSGTTGLTASHLAALHEAARKTAVLWAPNMSLGVAWLNHALKSLASLQGFEFQIHEIHHNRKKDRPSGTAALLQKTLEAAAGRPLPEPHATRGGGVFGVHQVYALSDEEQIVLEHTALNRQVFARGALRAARWMAGRAPGLYQIGDVLGLK